jgi:hypothetical protein
MLDLLERDHLGSLGVEVDERLARAELRRQIGHLERELASLFAEAFPRCELDCGVPASGAPRVLGLGELELVRDALADRIAEARDAIDARAEVEAENRRLLERMLENPAGFKRLRIYRSDVGEPGCGYWDSQPRAGLLGMLMGWWRVKVSSGCPL